MPFLSGLSLSKQPHGADDPRLLFRRALLDQTQAVFVAQGNHQFGQRIIADPALQLPIQSIGCALGQGVTIDVVYCLEQKRRGEESLLSLTSVLLESLVDAETGPGWPAKLATAAGLLGNDMLDS